MHAVLCVAFCVSHACSAPDQYACLDAPGAQPNLSRCLNDLPWQGWPLAEPPTPESSSCEDVVSAALRLMASSSYMPDGVTRAKENLVRYSRWGLCSCWASTCLDLDTCLLAMSRAC